MEFDLSKASKKLCELDFSYNYNGLNINVLWFRTMRHTEKWLISRHMHSSYEFHFIKEGSCEVITDNDRFIAKEGEFYLTAPSVFHEQRSLDDPNYLEYSMNCDLSILKETPSEMLKILHILDTIQCRAYQDVHNCCSLFNKALEEAYFEQIGFFCSIQSLIPLILVNAARCMSQNKPGSYGIPKKTDKNSFRMSQIERFIEDNISTTVSTSAIASYMHLSEKQVCRIIKEEKDMSTKEFVNNIKLTKAKDLLKNSDIHIKKISDLLGFSSEYYFSQFFKNVEGYPPAVYRYNLHKG